MQSIKLDQYILIHLPIFFLLHSTHINNQLQPILQSSYYILLQIVYIYHFITTQNYTLVSSFITISQLLYIISNMQSYDHIHQSINLKQFQLITLNGPHLGLFSTSHSDLYNESQLHNILDYLNIKKVKQINLLGNEVNSNIKGCMIILLKCIYEGKNNDLKNRLKKKLYDQELNIRNIQNLPVICNGLEDLQGKKLLVQFFHILNYAKEQNNKIQKYLNKYNIIQTILISYIRSLLSSHIQHAHNWNTPLPLSILISTVSQLLDIEYTIHNHNCINIGSYYIIQQYTNYYLIQIQNNPIHDSTKYQNNQQFFKIIKVPCQNHNQNLVKQDQNIKSNQLDKLIQIQSVNQQANLIQTYIKNHARKQSGIYQLLDQDQFNNYQFIFSDNQQQEAGNNLQIITQQSSHSKFKYKQQTINQFNNIKSTPNLHAIQKNNSCENFKKSNKKELYKFFQDNDIQNGQYRHSKNLWLLQKLRQVKRMNEYSQRIKQKYRITIRYMNKNRNMDKKRKKTSINISPQSSLGCKNKCEQLGNYSTQTSLDCNLCSVDEKKNNKLNNAKLCFIPKFNKKVILKSKDIIKVNHNINHNLYHSKSQKTIKNVFIHKNNNFKKLI